MSAPAINTVRRMTDRAVYDTATIHAILDASPMCHVGFLFEGQPFVLPMAHWRTGDTLYLHGANKGRLIEACAAQPICVTVSHFDGFVMARSAFNHSMNYRSVAVHGQARRVDDPDEKLAALEVFMAQHFPGRWPTLRPVKDNEMVATVVLALPITVAAAKVMSGPPDDAADDPDWPVWTGVLPVAAVRQPPEPDPTMPQGVAEPDYLLPYR